MSRHVLIVGAGAAGLMAGQVLAAAGVGITLLEARRRCGGRIWPLATAEFGYPAEGGAEFVHGAAPVTMGLLREAGLALAPTHGRRMRSEDGRLTAREERFPQGRVLYQALASVSDDLTVAEFLARRFPGDENAELRRAVRRMVEGYDAADPARASTLSLRDELFDQGPGQQGRIAGGYGGLVDFLAAQCRRHGAAIHLGAELRAIEAESGALVAICADGARHRGDAVILTVPVPLLREIGLPQAAEARAAMAAGLGYGNVVKILLRFSETFWRRAAPDMFFLFSEAPIPTWWTQHPAPHAVLTGWLAGPRADRLGLDEPGLVARALESLAEVFALPRVELQQQLVAARALDWGADPFARGAYSYVTPTTRRAQKALKQDDGSAIFFAGEALFEEGEAGTVEAALASGGEAAQAVLKRL